MTQTTLVPAPPIAPVKEPPFAWPAEPALLKATRDLCEMLTYCRPGGSKAEAEFIERFIRPLGVEEDEFGNLWKIVPDVSGAKPSVLWSAHTDTVHDRPGRQRIRMVGRKLKLAKKEKASCLGADNASGVWLLREMALARRPGLYIFHRLEEKGAKGAKFFVKTNRKLLDGIQAAIAFDRRGTKSIITHQFGQRTCSDAFAISLAEALDMGHACDDGGAYTDTAFYDHVVAECTNVSVGYENAHWHTEEQDVAYLLKLRKALLGLDTSDLVIARDPTAPPPVPAVPTWMRYAQKRFRFEREACTTSNTGFTVGDDSQDWDPTDAVYRTVADVMRDYPDEVADYLEQLGITPKDLLEHVEYVHGTMQMVDK